MTGFEWLLWLFFLIAALGLFAGLGAMSDAGGGMSGGEVISRLAMSDNPAPDGISRFDAPWTFRIVVKTNSDRDSQLRRVCVSLSAFVAAVATDSAPGGSAGCVEPEMLRFQDVIQTSLPVRAGPCLG